MHHSMGQHLYFKKFREGHRPRPALLEKKTIMSFQSFTHRSLCLLDRQLSCKAVVGGTAGPAMAVPLFSRACNNIVL